MIKVENLSYSFPQKDLYNNVSFTLEEGQHCALIGISGIGKSTLLDIIMDPERYILDGNLEVEDDWRIGYVSQFSEIDQAKDLTVFQYIGEQSIKLQTEIDSICSQMETAKDLEPLLVKYQEASDAFEALGGNDFESNISKKLYLANLSHLKDLMVPELSGGEFKLIQVIKEMLNAPDLIIMDEPDVFLDFDNLNSLKNLINSHKKTILVVTHSRYLLNHCFNKILHLENMELQEFDGRYIDYNFSLLESKIELQELAHADTEEIERNQVLLDKLRFIAGEDAEASKGRTVNARAKIQERLEARRVKTPFVSIKQPHIKLSTDKALDDVIALKLDNYNLAFEDILLEHVSFEIKANEKVVLIGPNGTGKTTLLREIFKNNNPSITIDENIELAYLSQLQGEMLDDSNTIFEEFFDSGFKSYDEITACLLDYGFEAEIANQKIESLSGGEKNILQLAKLSISKANMLLLDEPTSHLDTYSQIALEKAMKDYSGAILMVSHDFYSIVNCMDYALIIEDKNIRKMNMKKFKKMIYANHFDRDYLEIEEKKKLVETKIDLALKDNNFELAKTLLEEELEPIIKLL